MERILRRFGRLSWNKITIICLVVILLGGWFLIWGKTPNLPAIEIPRAPIEPQALQKVTPELTPISLPSSGLLLTHLIAIAFSVVLAILLVHKAGISRAISEAWMAINSIQISPILFLGTFLKAIGLRGLLFEELGVLGLFVSGWLFSTPVTKGQLYPITQIAMHLAARGEIEPVKFSLTVYFFLIGGTFLYFVEKIRRQGFDLTDATILLIGLTYLTLRVWLNFVWWVAIGEAILIGAITALIGMLAFKQKLNFSKLHLFAMVSLILDLIIATGY